MTQSCKKNIIAFLENLKSYFGIYNIMYIIVVSSCIVVNGHSFCLNITRQCTNHNVFSMYNVISKSTLSEGADLKVESHVCHISCLVHLRNKFHKICIITCMYIMYGIYMHWYGCANDTVNHSKTHAKSTLYTVKHMRHK